MKISLAVEGSHRYRVRVKILWFWIVGAWTEEKFKWAQDVNFGTAQSVTVPVKTPVGEFVISGNTQKIAILWNGIELCSYSPIDFGYSKTLPFHSEPVKGQIFEGWITYGIAKEIAG